MDDIRAQREVYTRPAATLGWEANFLFSENAKLVFQAQQTYGYKGERDEEELVADVCLRALQTMNCQEW